MILADASPLIAVCDKGQGENHYKCVNFLRKNNEQLISTLPCLTEAMYFLGKLAGWKGQETLWQLVKDLPLITHYLSDPEMVRMNELMRKYQDTPMDFADASLVTAAESLPTNRIFTLDSDFYVYRINETDSFEIVP